MTVSTTIATGNALQSPLPIVGELITGKVVAVLKDRDQQDSVPHALLLKFGSYSGRMRSRELDCTPAERASIMSKVRLGDEFSAMVIDVGTPEQPKYELSQEKRAALLRARSNCDRVIKGTVISAQKYGAFVNIGRGLSGLVHVSEMGSTNQKRRCEQLKKGMPINVVVLNVEADPNNPMRLRYHLSELGAELKIAGEKVGESVKTSILRVTDNGLQLALPNGVEAHLAYEEFNNMPLDGLKIGGPLEVVITGIIGRALSVTYKAKPATK